MARIDREQLGELLSGYIDGELNPREREIIERVLREDESARQLLADLQRTAQAVSSLPRHAAPASILGDTHATLERSALLSDFPEPRAHQTRGRSSWAARLAMAAMLGLVLVTGWWFTTEQTRRGSKGKTELTQRVFRDADDAKDEDELHVGMEKPSLGLASRAKEVPATSAVFEGDRSAGAAVATIEQQLAAGVDPSSFRSQTFAAEPVRLQVTVRDRAEREAVSLRIAAALSSQHLADLASAPGARDDTTNSVQNFYYRGKAGVNFDAANEDQILVRASPQQIDHLLTGLSEPNQPEEDVALVAGPITVQGVQKSRSVVQLLGEQQQAGVSQNERTRGDELFLEKNGATTDVNRASADKPAAPDGGLVGGLLKIVGIDPKLLSSGAKSTDRPGVAPVESAAEAASQNSPKVAADETSIADAEESAIPHRAEAKGKTAASAATRAAGQPPAPPPLVERRLRAAAESSRESGKKSDSTPSAEPALAAVDACVTLIIQIIETPRPTQPPQPAKKPDPPATRKVAE